ncbi:hypothetical protein MATL_G00070600 [Megalops atlanticus]|uniref:Properdin n=1 Tax=Megalops atlanticus TaxID=7932 RepID=A0A9D3Q9R9_MEGAT|nr:hypothetical protein MATL_G00070600 [Megalops atlanticus]
MLLWVIAIVLLTTQESGSQIVECYRDFDARSGSCGHRLGRVELDDCCLNPHYGFKGSDGDCDSCRPASWSEWTAWGPCTASCLEGVRQRRRFCYGLGLCNDTHGLGDLQTKACVEKDCCPVQGGWREWGPWQECSVTCGTGQRIRERHCSMPPPTCGGSCDGPSREVSVCDTERACPVHGGWSAWGSWGPCSGSCTAEGHQLPVRRRFRSCDNPQPSSDPRGDDCPGSSSELDSCSFLPPCPVPGGWGQWSSFSECSVTCGIGERVRTRQCDSPAPRHGGLYCSGEATSTQLCNTRIHCPVDGQWSEWTEWDRCSRIGKNINCKTYSAGTQRRERTCLHKDFGGDICPGSFIETRICYDIEKCRMYGNYSEWSEWGLCKPSCGPNAARTRTRECILDVSDYRLEVGPKREKAHFAGNARKLCRPPNIEREQTVPCHNVPSCTEP